MASMYLSPETFLQIAAGRVSNTGYSNKFGYNPNIGNAYETVWSAGGNYDFPTSATTCAVASSNSASDNGGTVEVSGLDANYNEITETITIGQTGSKSFLRVNRARLITANTGVTNAGNITCTVDTKTAADIRAGFGQTLQCVYTVPAGYNAYLYQIDGGVDVKEKPITLNLRTRDSTGTSNAWQTKAYLVFENTRMAHHYTVPQKIPEKHDIELRGISPDGALQVSGGFDLIINK